MSSIDQALLDIIRETLNEQGATKSLEHFESLSHRQLSRDLASRPDIDRAPVTVRKNYLPKVAEELEQGGGVQFTGLDEDRRNDDEEDPLEDELECGGQVCGDRMCQSTVRQCRLNHGINVEEGGDEYDQEDKPKTFRDCDQGDLQFVPSGRTSAYKAYMHWPSGEYWFIIGGKEPFDIPFSEVQYLIKLYVHAGSGLTGKTVTRRCIDQLGRDMTHGLLKKIFKALDIDKDSPPFAPHKLAEEDPDDLASVENLRAKAEAAVEHKMSEREPKALRRLVRKQARDLKDIKHQMSEAIEAAEMSPIEPRPVVTQSGDTNPEAKPYRPVVLLSDWHIGKKVDLPDNKFHLEVAWERIHHLTEQIGQFFKHNQRPFSEIVVGVLGDLVDGVLGNVYEQQWLEQDVSGRHQAVEAAKMLSEVLAQLHWMTGKPVHAVCTPGNHGRSGGNRGADPERFPEAMTYELAASYLSEIEDVQLQINDGDRVATYEVEEFGTQLLFTHGDRTPRDIRELGWSRMNERIGIASGHSHTDERSGVSDRHVYWQQNGALCGVDGFESDQIGKAFRPSQSMMMVDDQGPQPGRSFLLDSFIEQGA